MTREEIQVRIADLKRKVKAREGRAEYRENLEALKRGIATLERQLDG